MAVNLLWQSNVRNIFVNQSKNCKHAFIQSVLDSQIHFVAQITSNKAVINILELIFFESS